MRRLSVILTTVIMLTGITVSAQMHQGMNRSMQGDTSRCPQLYMKHMQGSRMMHPGMISMMHGRMKSMHGQGMMTGMPGMIGKGMHSGGMMSGMMGMHQGMPGMMHKMMVKKLPMMQDELNLESEQVKNLIDIKADFMKKKVDMRQNLMEQRQQVHKMAMDDVSADDYRSRLTSFYESRVEMQTAAYETYQQMKSVLTDQQQKKLEEKFQQCPYMKEGNMKKPFQKGVDEGMHEMH